MPPMTSEQFWCLETAYRESVLPDVGTTRASIWRVVRIDVLLSEHQTHVAETQGGFHRYSRFRV